MNGEGYEQARMVLEIVGGTASALVLLVILACLFPGPIEWALGDRRKRRRRSVWKVLKGTGQHRLKGDDHGVALRSRGVDPPAGATAGPGVSGSADLESGGDGDRVEGAAGAVGEGVDSGVGSSARPDASRGTEAAEAAEASAKLGDVA